MTDLHIDDPGSSIVTDKPSRPSPIPWSRSRDETLSVFSLTPEWNLDDPAALAGAIAHRLAKANDGWATPIRWRGAFAGWRCHAAAARRMGRLDVLHVETAGRCTYLTAALVIWARWRRVAVVHHRRQAAELGPLPSCVYRVLALNDRCIDGDIEFTSVPSTDLRTPLLAVRGRVTVSEPVAWPADVRVFRLREPVTVLILDVPDASVPVDGVLAAVSAIPSAQRRRLHANVVGPLELVDLRPLLTEAQILVVSGRTAEVAPVVLEAMAHGVVPVLVERDDEAVRDGENGRCVDASLPAMTQALGELVADDRQRALLAARARNGLWPLSEVNWARELELLWTGACARSTGNIPRPSRCPVPARWLTPPVNGMSGTPNHAVRVGTSGTDPHDERIRDAGV